MERKRHVGNDIVVIIFIDGEDDEAYQTALNFNPKVVTSRVNHSFALVTYNSSNDSYRLVVHSAESVPTFGPPLPPNGEFFDHMAFRDFLLAKCEHSKKNYIYLSIYLLIHLSMYIYLYLCMYLST